MARSILVFLYFALLYEAHAVECPKQKISPGREVVCYTTVNSIELLNESICKCTTIVHQGHDIRNFSTSDVEDLQKSLKKALPAVQFVISVNDPTNILMTSATVRQETAARIVRLLTEVDGVELNVTAGSKERLFHFVKNLKDETVRKSQDKRILLSLPVKPENLAKHFDLKGLAKYVDLFTTPTHYLTDEGGAYKTFHPSRMMGLFDMLNTDSLVDLITGLGAPKRKLLISLPASAYKFTLKNETENTPRSATTTKEPIVIDRKQLCEIMSDGEWTVERDEDLTAPYVFKNLSWISFDDEVSVGIKGKYVLLRELAGIGIHSIENDQKVDCGESLTHHVHRSFMDFKRKTRQAVLNSLEEDLHAQISYSSNRLKSSEFRVVRVVDTEGQIRVVRENTQTEFSCPRQGYFVHPRSCNRFYRCVKFNQEVEDYSVFEFDCPAGLAFDERTEVCVWPHSLPEGSPCPGSSEIAPSTRGRFHCPALPGYYADKQNCRWFFACMDLGGPELMPFEFRCPFGLVFDEQRLICEWPWLVPSCSDSGSAYARTEYDSGRYGNDISDQGANVVHHVGSFGFTGPATVHFPGSSDINEKGATTHGATFVGSTATQHYGTIGYADGVSQQHSASSSGYDKFSSNGHTDSTAHGYSVTADGHIYGTSEGSSGLGNSQHFGFSGEGYSTVTGQQGAQTDFEHSASVGGQYSGTATGGYTASTSAYSGTTDNRYGHSTSSNEYTGHTGAYFDRGYTQSLDAHSGSDNSGYSASSNQEYSGTIGDGHLLSTGQYSGQTGIYSQSTSDDYSKSTGKYHGSINVDHSGTIDGEFYKATNDGSTTSENVYINQHGTYSTPSVSGSSDSYRGHDSLGNAGHFGFSVGESTGLVSADGEQSKSTHRYPGHPGTYTIESADASSGPIYSSTTYERYPGSSSSGHAVTDSSTGLSKTSEGNNVVSYYNTDYTSSTRTGYASSFDATSQNQHGYAGTAKGSEQSSISFSSRPESDGYAQTVFPIKDGHTEHRGQAPGDSNYFVSVGPVEENVPVGISQSQGLSSTISGISSETGYASDTTKQSTNSEISSHSVYAGIDLTKSADKSSSGDISLGQTIRFTNSKSTLPTNYYGSPETNFHGQYYSTTTNPLHPGQIGVGTTYHGGYTTGEGESNTINATLVNSRNSFTDNINLHEGSRISTDYDLRTPSSTGLDFPGGYTLKTTGHHDFGSNIVSAQTVDGNVSGTVQPSAGNGGPVETGDGQAGYVNVSPGTSGYVLTGGIRTAHSGTVDMETLLHGTTAPGISFSKTPTSDSVYNAQSNSRAHFSEHTTPSVSLGESTAYGGFTGSDVRSSTYDGTNKAVFGISHYSGSTQTGGYSTELLHTQGGNYQGQGVEYHNEKDIPDYRPSNTIVPGSVVPGSVGNTVFPDNGSGLSVDGRGNVQSVSPGDFATNTGIFTQSGFTKTGPTKTGFTVATLGGRGTYIIGTSHPKPTLNPENIGEKAFEGNVDNNVNVVTRPTYDVKSLPYPTTTVAPNLITSPQPSDASDIDTSKIKLGPTGSPGYSYPKPSISFGADVTSHTTGLPTSAYPSGFVSSTTSKPLVNVQVYNTPSVVTSIPVTGSPTVVSTYSSNGFNGNAYQQNVFESEKTASDSIGSTIIHKRPTVTVDHIGSTPSPLTYTTGPLENYKTTIFEAAKIPVSISTAHPAVTDGHQAVVSTTGFPINYNTNKVTYNGETYQTGTSTIQPPDYRFISSSTPQYDQSYSTGSPQIFYGPTSTLSPPPSGYAYSTTPSTISDEDESFGRRDHTKVTFLSSTTSAPAVETTYRKPSTIPESTYEQEHKLSPSSKPDTFKGYSYPRPRIGTSSANHVNRGYTMTTLGSMITTAGSAMNEENIEKLMTSLGRGSVKYTPSYYESSTDGKDTVSPKFITVEEQGQKRPRPGVPVITTYSEGYSKTTPFYSISKPITAVGKGKVIVKWSDLHPLLLGKLGAQCTCRADPFGTLRGPASKKLIASSRGQVDLSNYDESDIYVDISNDESVEYKADYAVENEASYLTTARSPTDDVAVRIAEDSKPCTEYNAASGTSSSTYLPIHQPVTTPSSNYYPSAPARDSFGGVKTSTKHSVVGRDGVNYVLARRSGRKLEGDAAPSVNNLIAKEGASFDHFIPGGLQPSDEIMEGVSDCARPGLFRHPNFCNKFYACHWDDWKKKFTLYVFNCPVHLTFDSGVGACNWPSKGPACQNDNLLV